MIASIVTFAGVGYLKPASGTWASVVTVALAVGLFELGHPLAIPFACSLATVVGFWAVPKYLEQTKSKDPSEVVIDEVAGQLLALCFTIIPLWRHGVNDLFLGAWPAWVMPLLLFRLFDIWKPWLVGRADRRKDAAGVMLDDLWAGLFAGLLSVAFAGLYHGVIEKWL